MVVDAQALFVLYVADQVASRDFYQAVLGVEPQLDVPGMTEFQLGNGSALGLMPLTGARRLLGDVVGDGETQHTRARAELYLRVDQPAEYHRRALAKGALELSALQPRNWGEEAAYSLDPDGHVLAFARPIG